MFQKVHVRLAALCAGITIFILLTLSAGCLYIAEQSLKNSSFISFQNDMNTILGTLEQQTVLTHEWLKRMEDNGKYQIYLLDNDVPLLFGRQHTQEELLLFDKALDLCPDFPDQEAENRRDGLRHQEFSFSSAESRAADHYACMAVFTRNDNTLEVLILMSLKSLSQQILYQRLLFLSLDLAAAVILVLFAWHFTKRLLRPLEENQQKQVQFVAAASHELRTPLSVILSCASAAQKADEPDKLRFLQSIRSEGGRMSQLIEDMLLLSSADSQNWSIKKAPTELDTLLLTAYENFEPVTAEKSIRLRISLPKENIPTCLCDKDRIYQVLLILLQNAVSYTPAGGEIRLTLSHEQKHFYIQIIDNGSGIPEEQKKLIFQRFYRADTSHSKKGHFGLGLSIASEILRAHRGQIRVTDTPGGGSTFTVIL